MSVESNVSEILSNLQGHAPGSWSRQAAVIAEGVRGSGIIDSIEDASERMQTNLAGLAVVMGVSTQTIASEISLSNRFLNTMVDTLLDPRATAADERFRTGLTALRNGWRPEAIEELQESIKLFRFHAPAHAALGHALAAEGRLSEAAESYLLGQRYATPDHAELASGCALLAAAAFRDSGAIRRAVDILLIAADAFPQVPEVAIAYARLSEDTRHLRTALIVAPDLAVAALAAGVPDVENVVEEVAEAEDGPVNLAVRFVAALNALQSAFPSVVVNPPLPSLGNQSPVDELMASSVILADAIRTIAALRALHAVEETSRVPLGVPTAKPALLKAELEVLRNDLEALRTKLARTTAQLSRRRGAIELSARVKAIFGDERDQFAREDRGNVREFVDSEFVKSKGDLLEITYFWLIFEMNRCFEAKKIPFSYGTLARAREEYQKLITMQVGKGFADPLTTAKLYENEWRKFVEQRDRAIKDEQIRESELGLSVADLQVRVTELEAAVELERQDIANDREAQFTAVRVMHAAAEVEGNRWYEHIAVLESLAQLRPCASSSLGRRDCCLVVLAEERFGETWRS